MLRRSKEDVNFRPSTVRQLLMSRKMTEAILHFLMVTRVGQRPKLQKQKKKEQTRLSDEAWDLEEDRLKEDEGEEKERKEWEEEERKG